MDGGDGTGAVRIEPRRVAEPIEAFTVDELRHYNDRVADVVHALGCIVFPASTDHENVLVIFAGVNEQFTILSVARDVRCKVVYVQDVASPWYGGSAALPPLDQVVDFVRGEIGGLRPFLFGQSSGGYAALIAAARIDGAQVFVSGPQTFADPEIKTGPIYFGAGIARQLTPYGIADVRDVLPGRTAGKQISIVNSVTEHSNPCDSFFWMDHLHSTRMLGIENVRVYIAATSRHSIVQGRAAEVARLIAELIALSADEHRAARTVLIERFCDAAIQAG